MTVPQNKLDQIYQENVAVQMCSVFKKYIYIYMYSQSSSLRSQLLEYTWDTLQMHSASSAMKFL